MFRPADCAEFPNDNPGLHLGAIWCCLGPCEAATREPPASLPSAAPIPAPIPDEIPIALPIAVEEPSRRPDCSPEDGSPEGCSLKDCSPEEESSVHDEDPFAVLVRLLQEVAASAGASGEAGTLLLGLLGETRLDGAALTAAPLESLIAGGHVDPTPSGNRRSEALTRTVLAWRSILRGESEDFAACGSLPLDEWAADLVARALGNPAQKAALRRELRGRGLAAFGLVAQAA